MLKPPNRPRAPSAATLRVLYQLAYISSGAAVGVGALCAEERRRRTQIVQRVADNAKRLRQSPRYAHGAAAAAAREQEYEENFGWGGPDTGLEESMKGGVGGRRARTPENHREDAKMPELPSVVEEEYGRLVERKYGTGRKRNRTGRPPFVEEHGSRDPAAKSEVDDRRTRQAQAQAQAQPFFQRVQQKPASPLEGPPPSKELRKEGSTECAVFKPWDYAVFRRPSQYGLAVEGRLEAASRRSSLFHATKEGRTHRCLDSDYDGIANSFETREVWDKSSSKQQAISLKALSRDVDVFFEKVNDAAVAKIDVRHAGRIADALLQLSLELESGDHMESIILWKIAAKHLKPQDLLSLATAFTSIARSLGPDATVQLFSDLLVTSTYTKASPDVRLGLNLRLCAEALKLDAAGEHDVLFETLTSSVDIPDKMNSTTVVEHVGRECRRLMGSNDIPSAIRLWCLAMGDGKYKAKRDLRLGDDLFNAALDARYFSLCALILRTKDARSSGDHNHMKDALIKACFREGHIGLLRSLFQTNSEGGLSTNKNLSPQSYAYLSCCFSDRPNLFSAYYSRVPQHLRDFVVGSSINEAALALKANWKATRNLEAVKDSYKRTVSGFTSRGMNHDSVRPLHIAMVEIELGANRPLASMAALSRLNKNRSDASVFILTALALAKRQEWIKFGRLFEALRKDGRALYWDVPAKRAFNNALNLFSRSHSAEQLSEFFNMSMKELRFRPNTASWEILLTSLVSKRAMSLLQHWIDATSGLGSKLLIDAEMGAALLRRWYLECRISHVLVWWFCRNLAEAAPSLRGGPLLNNAREALAYDLRKLRGNDAPWLEPILRTRQVLIEGSSDVVPKPGHIWNQQLYVRGRLLTADTLRKQQQGASGETADVDFPQHQDATTDESNTNALPLTVDPLHGMMREGNTIVNAHESQRGLLQLGESTQENKITQHDRTNLALDSLRTQYEKALAENHDPDWHCDTTRTEELERQMIWHFSLEQHESVLELYHKSLDAVGLPASPIILEVAVESSLRANNDRHEAENIMSAARDAGMKVTCAMGPLLIDQITHMSRIDRQGAADLRSKTMDYYRTNEQNGLHVKHHLAAAAAHTLIRSGFAEHGVNLLHSIRSSQWSAEKPLDIVAMSVWLSGYAALGHKEGIRWVIEEVLDRNLIIDRGFLGALKSARHPPYRLSDGKLGFGKQDPRLHALLKRWYVICAQKRQAQMQESKVFGRELVKVIARAAREDTPKPAVEDAGASSQPELKFAEGATLVEPFRA